MDRPNPVTKKSQAHTPNNFLMPDVLCARKYWTLVGHHLSPKHIACPWVQFQDLALWWNQQQTLIGLRHVAWDAKKEGGSLENRSKSRSRWPEGLKSFGNLTEGHKYGKGV